jgi:hypothetical protein
MIHEYALEPQLISNWQEFRYFTEKFGVPQGRLISRYPKSWKRLVYESLENCGEIERKKIEEKLNTLDDRILRRPSSGWDPQLQWLANAEIEHGRKPFHAVLARDNPNGQVFVLRGEDVEDINPLWGVQRTEVVPREAAPMAHAIAPLLQVSNAILFVDPHFNPNREEYRKTLREFFTATFERREYAPPGRIEVHLRGGDDKPDAAYFAEICRRWLPNLIPAGVQLRLVRWQQRAGGEELHNRYVLTNLGGIRFGAGLDEGDGGETDELEILDGTAYKVRYRQYDRVANTFDLVDQLVVIGTRRPK